MDFTAIDGDLSDFIDSQIEVTDTYQSAELRGYLLNAGHSDADADTVILAWMEERFRPLDPQGDTFSLTAAGLAAVEQLRDRL